MNRTALLSVALLYSLCTCSQNQKIIPGAEQVDLYLKYMKGKRVGIVANPSTTVGSTHLVDSLTTLKVKLVKIFSPEHGFRGDGEAGEFIKNHPDQKTGLPVISLYGSKKKPTPADLKGIDLMLFDLQDVGVRYYTYISTMHYVMEACAENGVELVILDRPNPNGFYVDGPVLDTSSFRSFVGLHPVPLVHGMTIGEYALMINGEGWLKHGVSCSLKVIACSGYSHKSLYRLPQKPSPNLPNQTSVLLYPSLGLFEGTPISIGRGTAFPFQVFGHPTFPQTGFSFTPVETPGASINPPFKGEVCWGFDLRDYSDSFFVNRQAINLEWLIAAYRTYKEKTPFFNSFFDNLSGTNELRKQIEQGVEQEAIRSSWEKGIGEFKKIRKRYLLYPDFE